MLKKVVIAFCLILWPLNLILNVSHLQFSLETVFKKDDKDVQLILQNIAPYPNRTIARFFQNKPRIYINKYLNNFFAITDPNYYFFSAHPRPVEGNINISKYPFASILFLLISIFNIRKMKYKQPVTIVLITSLIFLPFLSNFDGFDFILWIPISLLIINGVNILEAKNKKIFTVASLVFILFSIPEILRSFYIR